MKKNKQIIGILGLCGVVIFLAVVIYSIFSFENGAFSPLGCFISELGFYTSAYMGMSTALIFNIGFMVSGLIICAFMVNYGLQKNSWLYAAVSFFGILSGVLMAAQGIFCLNFSNLHYIVSSVFFVSVFIMCVLFIIAEMLSSNFAKSSLANIIAAFFAGITSAIFSAYVISGGMEKVFIEDSSIVGRQSVLPFAIVEWVAIVLVLAFFALLAVHMLIDSRKTDSVEGSMAKEPRRINVKKADGKDLSDTRSVEL